MPRENDVAFGFDPRPFLKGLGQVTKGLEGLTKKTASIAGQMVKKFLLVGIAVKGFQKLIGEVRQHAPEIGQSFSIATDIIAKNFLMPLRRFLLPILQKMLNWVRDHRTAFVRWGSVLVNVVRGAIGVVKSLYDFFVRLINIVGPAFKNIFGSSFADFLNLLAAKFAVIAAFLGRLVEGAIRGLATHLGEIVGHLKEIFENLLSIFGSGEGLAKLIENIGGLISSVVELATRLFAAFTKGFADAMQGAIPALNGIVSALKEMLDGLRDWDSQTGILSKSFKALGLVLGVSIVAPLMLAWIALRGILDIISFISGNKAKQMANAIKDNEMWSVIGTYGKGLLKSVNELAEPTERQRKSTVMTPYPAGIGAYPVRNAITPVGGKAGQMNEGASAYTFNITVPQSDTPEATGKAIGVSAYEAMHSSMRKRIINQRYAMGMR